MAGTYCAEIVDKSDGVVTIRLSFGDPAQNNKDCQRCARSPCFSETGRREGHQVDGPLFSAVGIAISTVSVSMFRVLLRFSTQSCKQYVCMCFP